VSNKRGNGGEQPDIEEVLWQYVSGIETADILSARADPAAFDGVMEDPSLITAAAAEDRAEHGPAERRIDDTRELLTWLATRYDGAIGGRLLWLMFKEIGANDQALSCADEYFRYLPEIGSEQRSRQRAELAQRYKWLRGL